MEQRERPLGGEFYLEFPVRQWQCERTPMCCGQAAVESLFDQNGVDIYFCGHDHHYERSYQIYNKTAVDKDSDLVAGGGIVYIVSGGGGAPLYSVGNRWWTKTATSTNHYVELTATGALLSVRTKNLSGNTMDSFTISQ